MQRSDVASASSRSDQFDFLIDIVPREEPPKANKRSSNREDPAPEVCEWEKGEGERDTGTRKKAKRPHTLVCRLVDFFLIAFSFIQLWYQAEAYEEHQQQYTQYYPQAPGSLAGYSHVRKESSPPFPLILSEICQLYPLSSIANYSNLLTGD